MRLFGLVDGKIDRFDRPGFFGTIFDGRWYHTFPTLSRAANFRQFTDDLLDDPTIRSKMENGEVHTRPRFTATKQKWTVLYSYLTAADKALLKTLQDNVRVGADIFRWTNPTDDIEYDVRLAQPGMKFKLEPRHPDKWEAMMTMVEV